MHTTQLCTLRSDTLPCHQHTHIYTHIHTHTNTRHWATKKMKPSCHQGCSIAAVTYWGGGSGHTIKDQYRFARSYESNCLDAKMPNIQKKHLLPLHHSCPEKPETCSESESLPVAKNCRCDPEASSVDCVEGRYCFEKKCRTQVRKKCCRDLSLWEQDFLLFASLFESAGWG